MINKTPTEILRRTRLTRRAKHWQNGIIEKSLVQPARDNPRRAFSFRTRIANTRFDSSGKTLAEWHHRNEFGSARAGQSAAGFLISNSDC